MVREIPREETVRSFLGRPYKRRPLSLPTKLFADDFADSCGVAAA